MEKKNFFPMYKRCDNQEVVVIGGGNIAYRRVCSLLQFNLRIKVIAPQFSSDFDNINKDAQLICDVYRETYISDCFFVLVCTDDSELNIEIANYCKANNIEVNVASKKEECNFYFPYLINTDEVTVAIVGDGSSHKRTKEIGQMLKNTLKGTD